jgi:hypothetical protein
MKNKWFYLLIASYLHIPFLTPNLACLASSRLDSSFRMQIQIVGLSVMRVLCTWIRENFIDEAFFPSLLANELHSLPHFYPNL